VRNKTLLKIAAMLIFALPLITNVQIAHAGKRSICVDAEGNLWIRRRCPIAKGYTHIRKQADLLGQAGDPGINGEDGKDGNPEMVGFARVNPQGTLLSFGGSATFEATTEVTSLGLVRFSTIVRFAGDYEGLTENDSEENQNKVSVLVTAESGTFSVANAVVTSASSSEIVIRVKTYNFNEVTITNINRDGFFAAVLVAGAAQ